MKRKLFSIIVLVVILIQLVVPCTVFGTTVYPTVTSVTPSGDSVTKAAIGKIEFDTAMDITTLTSENIVVTDEEGTVVAQTESSAYDTVYTFMCDFEAGTTYTVTVSSNVKSAEDIALLEYTHTFTTAANILETTCVSPTNDESYFYYPESGQLGKVSNVYGGNTGSYWANNANVSKQWFGVNLQKAYDIAYIAYVPGFPSEGATWGNNISIQVSNDSDFADYETLALTPTLSAYDGTVRYMVANDTDEKYQYVRLYKPGRYMGAADFMVYAYPDAPAVTSVTPSGDNVTKAAIGKVEFDTAMDITTLTSENIVVTDAEGTVVSQTESSAYDSAYTFICDFEAGTTYTVTVSSNVKSAVGINAETYTHTFTTADELLIAENVSPTNDESYFYYPESGQLGKVLNAYSTTSPAYWANNASVTKVWFGVDLGKAYDIAYIAYVPGFPSASASWANNINIQVSNDSEFETYETLALTPTLSACDKTIRYMVANDTDEKYQYVRLYKAGSYMALADFLVYAYAEAPTIEAITPSGDNVTKAATCKVKFDMAMDRATLTSENIVIKDKDGNILEQKNVSVYDTEYVFMCDFEGNTTYKVTVSTNVKSKAGLPIEKAVEHTFTTGTYVYDVIDVTPDTEESFSHNASGECTEQIMNVFDKNPATGWNTYGSVKPKWLMVDLGKEVEIAYINYVPGLGNDSVGWASDVSIQVSETEDFANPVTLAVTPSLTTADNYKTVAYTVAPSESSKYRYVRVWENATHISVYELTVYGYEEEIEFKTSDDFEQIYGADVCKLNNYGIYGSLVSGGKVSFVSEMTLVDDNAVMPDVYMAVYDGGALVDISKGNVRANCISAQIEIPKSITDAEIKMFVWSEDMKPMIKNIVKEIQ